MQVFILGLGGILLSIFGLGGGGISVFIPSLYSRIESDFWERGKPRCGEQQEDKVRGGLCFQSHLSFALSSIFHSSPSFQVLKR